jgi:hypothetical protein
MGERCEQPLVGQAIAVVVAEVAGLFRNFARSFAWQFALGAARPSSRAATRGRAGYGGSRCALEGLVGAAITVVITAVTELRGVRVNELVRIVTVATRGRVSNRRLARLHWLTVAEAVAVAIGIERGEHPVVDDSIAVVIETIAGLPVGLVHHAVAVVVHPIGAQLRGAGIRFGALVVAVSSEYTERAPGCLRGRAVAIVIFVEQAG